MITEGQKVAFAGDDPLNEVGAPGRVLALSGSAAHVQWSAGPKQGQIELVERDELVPATAATAALHQAGSVDAAESFSYALDTPATEMIKVRATYDETGEDGIVNAMEEAGHLAMLAEYAERALEALSGDLRADPVLGGVLSSLEPDEADTVISRVATVLLSDRIKEA